MSGNSEERTPKFALTDVVAAEAPPVVIQGFDSLGERLKDIPEQPRRRHREEGDFTLGCLKLFRTRTRFVMVVLVLFCLASVWSNILSFNFAVMCMNPHGDDDLSNVTTNSSGSSGVRIPFKARKAVFTPRQRTYLTSAVAAAALVANFPVVSMVNQFGIRTVFTILGLFSAFATCLIPSATTLGFYYILGARVLQGVAFAANFPVIGEFTSKWTYYKQNGLFVSILVAYVQLAPALTMPASGALCSSSWGWPSVYYAHGIASLMLFCAFGIFYRNSPGKHPFVSEQERDKIAVGKTECTKEEISHIPYAEILKTASVWAVWIAATGNFLCVNVLFLYSPTYLHRSLGFEVSRTGFAAALPPLLQFVIKLLAGFSSDKVHFLGETGKLRLYNSIAFMGCALFLVILSFMPLTMRNVSVLLLGGAAGLLGFNTGGFFKAAPLVSKHFSPFVTGNVSLGITVTMLVVPIMVSNLAPENTLMGWSRVFITTAAILALSNLVFCIIGSADAASWTTDEFSRNASRNRMAKSSSRNLAPQVRMG